MRIMKKDTFLRSFHRVFRSKGLKVQDFNPNGCTGVPNWDAHTKCCCDEHDWYYVRGGHIFHKIYADLLLGYCVIKNGDQILPLRLIIGPLYCLGTSVFGVFFWDWRLSPLKLEEPKPNQGEVL